LDFSPPLVHEKKRFLINFILIIAMQKHCYNNGRRDFIRKASFTAALYTIPSFLVNAEPVARIAPGPAPKEQIKLVINGKEIAALVDIRVTLLDFLREQLGYTGTKKGCGMGQCGACIIHINGKRMNSCQTLAINNNGNNIVTVEGLAKGEDLHPMQEAFIKCDAMQCGYCTPGQIMSGIACIRDGRAGSREEIQRYMAGNICRCGAYQNIVDAISQVKASGKTV
jgi:xanthine dehydrogenase YagT iron-sulfur-binding subunit